MPGVFPADCSIPLRTLPLCISVRSAVSRSLARAARNKPRGNGSFPAKRLTTLVKTWEAVFPFWLDVYKHLNPVSRLTRMVAARLVWSCSTSLKLP